ncbi:hypothetical protein BDB01DRAFT_328908 [Pilobolus umbonatus]|nr:hypothetical protein BDB01DRAFT_328908 [Pilobolus umbonatus]
MKYILINILVLLVTVGSAQSSKGISGDIVPSATMNTMPTCNVQSTFELCLQNEDKYINTCEEQDYACLCRWNKEKLTCWNNCPNDGGLASQAGIVSGLCSMPGANVTIPLWTSSLINTPTPIVATSIKPSSPQPVPTTSNNVTSAALTMKQGIIYVIGACLPMIISLIIF